MTLSEVEEPNQYWFLYIAISIKTSRYYTGISTDPTKRIIVHNDGRGSKFAIDQGPLRLVYVSIPFTSKSEA